MKICPLCKTEYEEELNFCLSDGAILRDSKDNSREEIPVSFREGATLEYQSPQTFSEKGQTQKQNQVNFGHSYSPKYKRQPNFLLVAGIVSGIIILIFGGIIGGGIFLRSLMTVNDTKPTPKPIQSVTPYRPPTPDTREKLKIEVVGKVKGSFGSQFLKCMVTNISEKIVERPSVSITLYEKDVKIGNISETSKLGYLKPNQTIPVWVRLGSEKKFDSTKATEGGLTRFADKDEKMLFPTLTLTETKMVVEKKTSMYNFQSYAENFYIVGGIVENRDYDKILPKIYVVYYDEKSEIVGFAYDSISELKKGEKAKFEMQAGETELFGTPKTFELIVMNN
jgi:hypothetical protein